MKSKRITWMWIILFFFILCAGGFLGYMDAKALGIDYRDEKVQTVSIADEQDIINLGDSYYNNICNLTADILIDEIGMLGKKNRPFEGTFDGHGHTIVVMKSVAEPLFGYIGKNGVIRNLKIRIGDSIDMGGGQNAVVALENLGRIEDCKIEVGNCNVAESGRYAGIVAVNYGTVKNVITNISVNNLTFASEDGSSGVFFGSIAAYNYGKIEGCLSEVKFANFKETSLNEVIMGEATNNGIGAICGINNGTMERNLGLIEKSVYTSDTGCEGVLLQTSTSKTYVDETITLLRLNRLKWTLLNNSFDFIEGEI